MHRFVSYDGTEISYRTAGDGPPLMCLPGGPGRAAQYLGELGGLDAERRLILVDPRGVGHSADPADPASLRVDRLVQDVESLRIHLGLERMDLLAHSAGANLALLYAAKFPERLSRLVLVTPGLGALAVHPVEEQFDAVLNRLTAEPWYPEARAALEKILTGDLSPESFAASRPVFYAHWNEAARAHAMLGTTDRHQVARVGYFAGADIDPPSVQAALTRLAAPVLLHVGDLDPLVTPAMAQQAAPLFPNATVVVQPGAGHFPWVDDPAAFAAALSQFLTEPR